jgi:hypothetical protein
VGFAPPSLKSRQVDHPLVESIKNTQFNENYVNIYVQPAQMSSSVFADTHIKRRTAPKHKPGNALSKIFIDLAKRIQ